MIYKIDKKIILEEASRRLEKALTKAVVISKVRDNPNNLKKLMKGLSTNDNIGTPKEVKPKKDKIIKFDKQTISGISNSAREIIKEKTIKEKTKKEKPKYKKLDILV